MLPDSNIDTVQPYQSGATGYSYRQVAGSKPNFGVDEVSNMRERIVRVEPVLESHEKIMADIRADLRGIRTDIQNIEKRVVDKMDENHKWLVGLIISSILVPLLIALVTK
ncbi:hypothetical protein [Klebsiella variicola]|uniref:hypothetical protein n=1 Tax=Klebsiella variicola TaxID=244366 RepID=UPI0010341BCA|nr:hypothetical protein [Klebsiella variicola]